MLSGIRYTAPYGTTRGQWLIQKQYWVHDRVHELAVKRKDDVLMENYRKLRNSITGMIKNRKREYFNEVSHSLRTSPRSFWSKLNSVIPKINMKSIPKGMGAEDFYIYFKTVPDIITSSFTDDSSLLWKGQESIYTFKFNDIQRSDLLELFISLSDKTGMDILGFDRKLIKIAGHHIADSLLYIIIDSLSNGVFPEDWKLARVTPVLKTTDRKWQDYVYIQCEYKSTWQKIKHLLREENKVKENKIP